jgi:hypothetical protein
MKNLVRRPRREHMLVVQALKKLGIRYWEQVRVWNPIYTGLRREVKGDFQWLEFVIRLPYGKPAVLLFHLNYGGSRPHKFEVRAMEQKKTFLEQKGIPYIVLSRQQSQSEYETYIDFWIRKEKRKHEKQIR